MFYTTLGNLTYYDTAGNPNQPGAGLSNTGPFSNLQSASYWSATDNVTDSGQAWLFYFYLDRQYDGGYIPNNFYAGVMSRRCLYPLRYGCSDRVSWVSSDLSELIENYEAVATALRNTMFYRYLAPASDGGQ